MAYCSALAIASLTPQPSRPQKALPQVQAQATRCRPGPSFQSRRSLSRFCHSSYLNCIASNGSSPPSKDVQLGIALYFPRKVCHIEPKMNKRQRRPYLPRWFSSRSTDAQQQVGEQTKYTCRWQCNEPG